MVENILENILIKNNVYMSGLQRHILIHCNLKKLRIFLWCWVEAQINFQAVFIYFFIFSSGSSHASH
jgi:hypothetical protein